MFDGLFANVVGVMCYFPMHICYMVDCQIINGYLARI